MAQLQKTTLLTAFEPFGGRDRNASAEALVQLVELPAGTFYPLLLVAQHLPVETGRAAQLICRAIDQIYPDYVICLGEAKRDAICLERVGYNELCFTIPDNVGKMVQEQPVVPDAPLTYPATLPLEIMLPAMQKTGAPVRISDDPGRYLCNEVLFSTLHHIIQHNLSIQAGFIHVPRLPEAATEPDHPCLPTAETVRALTAGLLSLAGVGDAYCSGVAKR